MVQVLMNIPLEFKKELQLKASLMLSNDLYASTQVYYTKASRSLLMYNEIHLIYY